MPNLDEATTTDLMSAWGALIGGSATAIAATAGVAAAIAAIRTLNASKRDSRDKARPMVGAELERHPHPGSRTTNLLVRNYGQSVAYKVKVTFDPPLVDGETRAKRGSLMPYLLNRYRNPIENLMPGVELRNFWHFGVASDDGKTLVNDMPIPDVVIATIRYSDRPDFWAKSTNRYKETFTLDMGLIQTGTSSTFTDDHLGLHKRSTKALEEAAEASVQAAKNIDRIQSYLKPEAVKEREAAEYAESKQTVAEIVAQVLPNRNETSTVEG
ncbi:hypothetical protein [Rhodococcus sp. (in: high G+C Gram-positive bacteria)]|uniref:hypothetical protein n=1 Tax=Rhodococcus sp. TaxID=1831 RepID=UPI00257DB7C2|nr:hypothetical protein [Rhodococcus sp. (in: high G+C Gram-positive bacteria)]